MKWGEFIEFGAVRGEFLFSLSHSLTHSLTSVHLKVLIKEATRYEFLKLALIQTTQKLLFFFLIWILIFFSSFPLSGYVLFDGELVEEYYMSIKDSSDMCKRRIFNLDCFRVSCFFWGKTTLSHLKMRAFLQSNTLKNWIDLKQQTK
jgi:hypothetical protein